MKLDTLKQLRKAMELWESSLDQQDEFGNTLISRSLTDELDVLSRMVIAEHKIATERQKRVDDKIKERGTARGRIPIVLPDAAALRLRLRKTTKNALAKELGVCRRTIYNRIMGNYVKDGVVREYLS